MCKCFQIAKVLMFHIYIYCPESSCHKRFKFNKYILKFKSSVNFPSKPARTFQTTQYIYKCIHEIVYEFK